MRSYIHLGKVTVKCAEKSLFFLLLSMGRKKSKEFIRIDTEVVWNKEGGRILHIYSFSMFFLGLEKKSQQE